LSIFLKKENELLFPQKSEQNHYLLQKMDKPGLAEASRFHHRFGEQPAKEPRHQHATGPPGVPK